MASSHQNQIKSMLLLALLFLITNEISVVDCYKMNSSEMIRQFKFIGGLCCTRTGDFEMGCRGLGGVTVSVECDGGRTNLVKLITDDFGHIDTMVGMPNDASINPFECVGRVSLPVVGCDSLPSHGRLLVDFTPLAPIVWNKDSITIPMPLRSRRFPPQS